MTTQLLPLQKLVATHYCNGEFNHVKDTSTAENCGDGLFSFLIMEAANASGPHDYREMLRTAKSELEDLISVMEDL